MFKINIPKPGQLTDKEIAIFSFIKETCEKFAPDTYPRVAGGWVRDRLLGKESHDIDIAINNMTGKEFVKILAKNRSNIIDFLEGYVVTARPEQSKHLETASCKLYGQEIEFTNLRKETYSDSRIPQMEFGTPEEDAARRDLTINSLFYNIRSEQIEDFTGFGLRDLEDGFARTPSEAKQTFLDDPLRILRVIRFASRFNLKVCNEIKAAAACDDVQTAFKNKISRERIWAETVGMAEPGGWKRGFLTGSDPYRALQLTCQFKFRDILFNPRDEELVKKLNDWDTDQNSKWHDLPIWGHTFLAFRHLTTRIPIPESPEEQAIRHLALICHDLGKRDSEYRQLKDDGTYSYHGHEERSAELAEIVLTDLACPTDIKKRVVRLCAEHQRFLHMSQGKGKPSDKAFRKIVADLEGDWENLCDISESDAYGHKNRWDESEIKEFHEMCRERIRKVLSEQNGQSKVTRPISGHDLMKLNIKPGPGMGQLLKALDEELLERPGLTKEESLEFIKALI